MTNDKWHTWYKGFENLNLIVSLVWFGFLFFGAWFGINQFKVGFGLDHWAWNAALLVVIGLVLVENFFAALNLVPRSGYRDLVLYFFFFLLAALGYQGFTGYLGWKPVLAILFFLPALALLIWSHLASK